MRSAFLWALLALWAAVPTLLFGQLDPERRRLLQIGYNQPIQGKSPISGYGFFYYNQPEFYETNLTLRAAIAPVYVDAELGFKHLISPRTDFAIGISGGGFAKSYDEIHEGEWIREESFTGHGAEFNSSIYHLFNPGHRIPLYGILRGAFDHNFYERDDKTASDFRVPSDLNYLSTRVGLRFGGKEPTINTPLAMELSIWYSGELRLDPQVYGYDDRRIEPNSHLFWTRALLAYTFDTLRHRVEASLTTGTSMNADRFSAYRLGGVLPFASEFPLSLPGYYYREISARRFVLFSGQYSVPLDPKERFQLQAYGSSGGVDYVEGLEQPGKWHSGVGGGVTFRAPSGSWLVSLLYGHGFNSIRSDGRGSDQIALILQYDFETQAKWFDPGVSPYRSRMIDRLFRN